MTSLLFKEEMEKEKERFSALSFKNQRRNLRALPQKGKTTKAVDEVRDALMPGKRISKAGNVYWETRKNRSDAKNSNI